VVLAGVGLEGGEEAVDADGVREALAVGDLQCLVHPVAEPARLDALLGGQHGGAGGAEDVVVGGRAVAVAAVGPEAGEDLGVGELAQAVLGPVVGAEERLAELVAGEHPVLEDEAQDGAVAVGEPAGERGELLSHAASRGAATRTRTLAGGVVLGVHAGGLRQESAALNELATGRVACARASAGGAGSKVGGRPGARPAAGPADRPAMRRWGGCRRACGPSPGKPGFRVRQGRPECFGRSDWSVMRARDDLAAWVFVANAEQTGPTWPRRVSSSAPEA